MDDQEDIDMEAGPSTHSDAIPRSPSAAADSPSASSPGPALEPPPQPAGADPAASSSGDGETARPTIHEPSGRPYAPRNRLPKSHTAKFNSIELPGALTHSWVDAPYSSGPMGLAPVPSSPLLVNPLFVPPRVSPEAALTHLGGQDALDAVFNRGSKVLECRLAPKAKERWEHPLIGEAVDVQRVLVRIVRRRRRRKVGQGQAEGNEDQVMRDGSAPAAIPVQGGASSTAGPAAAPSPVPLFAPASTGPPTPAAEDQEDIKPTIPARTDLLDEGIFKVEMMGVVQRTVRFRAMGDYQFFPDKTAVIPSLMEKLLAADPHAIEAFRFSRLDEEYFVPIEPEQAQGAAQTPEQVTSGTAEATAAAGPSQPGPSAIAGPSAHLDPALQADSTGTPAASDATTAADSTAPQISVIDLSAEQPIEPPERIWADNDIRFRSRINVLPSPLFSRQVVWPNVGYAPNPMSRTQTVVDPITGETTTRLHNIARNKGSSMTTVRFGETELPTGPTQDILATESELDPKLIAQFKEMLEKRPVWTRLALMSQFNRNDQKALDSKKTYFPLCAWTYIDGPFRDLIIRFGYNPETDPESYLYQRVYFRGQKTAASGIRETVRRDFDLDFAGGGRGSKGRDSELARKRAELAGQQLDPDKGYIFDGITLHRDVANYQLLDVTDPLLSDLIRREDARKDELTFANGWFHKNRFEAIKSILRRKWQLLSDGRICTDIDLEDLIKEYEEALNTSDEEANKKAASVEAGEVVAIGADGEALPVKKKGSGGRPKGGGGYAAGRVPAGTTVRQLTTAERWKRKGTAYIPLNEEQLAARRLQRAIEREDRQARHATMRVAVDEEENDAESELSE